MRLLPYERKLMNKKVKEGMNINFLADFFGVSRKTVWYWKDETQNSNFKNLPKNPKGKVNLEVEVAIIEMRIKFNWGSARIQQGLFSLPDFQLQELEYPIQNFRLSRTSINNVLKKHKRNGYKKRKNKSWKFFRAKYKNQLWQIDLKEFKFEGKKYYISIVIDDYSRYIVSLTLFDHCPTTEEITAPLQNLGVKPKKLLADNGGQFQDKWKRWCKEQGIKPVFAHPYYPQDKGKVERTIRSLAEEFVNLLGKFRYWIDGKIEEWRRWYNEKRYHRGIKDCPSNLYVTV